MLIATNTAIIATTISSSARVKPFLFSFAFFNSQLEKSREAVDAANIRAAYAEITADALTGKTDTTKTITPKQTNAGWQTKFDFPEGLVTKTGSESTKIVNSTNVTLAWENNQVTVTCSLAQETK